MFARSRARCRRRWRSPAHAVPWQRVSCPWIIPLRLLGEPSLLRASKTETPVSIEQEELRGISRTVAEIHWLLLILVLLYLIFGGTHKDSESNAAISSGLFFYAALVMTFRYANFYKRETRWKIAF